MLIEITDISNDFERYEASTCQEVRQKHMEAFKLAKEFNCAICVGKTVAVPVEKLRKS